MSRAMLRTVLVAAMVVLAGCAGGVPGGTATGDGTNPDGSPAAGDGTAGTVNFYLSDQPNAIEDFEHLNVTVSKVGFHRVGDAEDGDANRTTTAANGSTTVANETAANATTTTAANVTTTADGDESGDGRWVTYDAPNVSVDLTRLVGANATRLAEFGVPEGEYDAVFVHVSSVEGTLDSGEEVRVKLPSEKLQLHSEFRVGANASVDFVYDIAVHKAGKSGKYILRPVVSESGTEVDIEDVDDRGDGDDRDGDDDRSTLDARFVGNVTPGENATISVTRNGSAVANATVEVDGGSVVRTGANGTATVAVPDDEEFEVEVEAGDDEAELEAEFEEQEREDEARDGDDSDGNESDDRDDGAKLSAEFVGNVTADGNVTLAVTRNGSAVANATVTVDGEVVGTTDADGRLSVAVPTGGEFEVVVETEDGAEAEFEVHVDGEVRVDSA